MMRVYAAGPKGDRLFEDFFEDKQGKTGSADRAVNARAGDVPDDRLHFKSRKYDRIIL